MSAETHDIPMDAKETDAIPYAPTKRRPRIELTDTGMDIIMKMSEGNPGAVSVLMKLLEDPMGLMKVLDLDDMGMRGSQIWIAWKDHCKQDLPTFLKALDDRDQGMVNTVNASRGNAPGTPQAVRFGASP